MELERYLIKKGKSDLLSSLKALDKDLLREKMAEKDIDNIQELKQDIIDEFDMCLDMSKEDIFTVMYFKKIVENQDSIFLSAYKQDIDALWVFIYRNGNHYSYYIPTEIREIIRKYLKF